MVERIDLTEKVVAVFDTTEATDAAVTALRADGYDVEVLEGEEGRERLDPDGEDKGVLASLRGAVEKVLGDEDRILDNVDAELARDHSFVVVDSSESDEAEIAAILKEHGGHYRWHFDKWTYVSLGGGAKR
jgi:hypothetical protein